jgi:hypothetical protein
MASENQYISLTSKLELFSVSWTWYAIVRIVVIGIGVEVADKRPTCSCAGATWIWKTTVNVVWWDEI